jgi:hypothetical protein
MDDFVKGTSHAFCQYQPRDHQIRGHQFRTIARRLEDAGDSEGSAAHERAAQYHFSEAERRSA